MRNPGPLPISIQYDEIASGMGKASKTRRGHAYVCRPRPRYSATSKSSRLIDGGLCSEPDRFDSGFHTGVGVSRRFDYCAGPNLAVLATYSHELGRASWRERG